MWEYFGSVKLYVWLQRSQFSLFKYVSINTCKHLYSCTQRCTHRNTHVCAGIDKSGYVDNFPLNFACTCQHRWPKPLRPRMMGRGSGAWRCPCLSQQHGRCPRPATAARPARSPPRPRPLVQLRPPAEPPPPRRGARPLRPPRCGPPRPASLRGFTSRLLEAELGFQLMTQRYRGSMHW